MAAFVGSIEHSAQLKSDNFCEIGVKHAGSSLCITQALNALGKKSNLFCIDVDPKSGEKFKKNVPQNGPCKGTFIHGCSWKVVDQVPNELAWLFIDGCHCYDCTRKDIELFVSKVQRDGIVIMHDCDYRVQLRAPSQRCGGTRKKVGVYDAMMKTPELTESCYLIHMVEGAIDPKGFYWNGLAVWRKK
jgi:hypothetical protein